MGKHSTSTNRAKRDVVARLHRFRERHPHLKDADVARGVGVAACTVNKWMNGNAGPNAPVRANLTSYMDSVDSVARTPAGTTPHHPHVNPDGGQPSNGSPSARVALIVRLMGPLSPKEVEAVAVAALDLMGGGA